MEEELQEYDEKRPYKIMPGDTVKIIRNEYGGKTFYKADLCKNLNGNKDFKIPKVLQFPKGDELPDGCAVVLKSFFEDAYYRLNDRFNPQWILVVLDYERVDVSPELTTFDNTNTNEDLFGELPF